MLKFVFTVKLYCCCILSLLAPGAVAAPILYDEPDSVYLFAYATDKNNNHNGLHFAWSHDSINWHPIGNDYGFLRCDYGRWGSEKRLVTPYCIKGADNIWQCIWSVNEYDKAFAHAASADLINWSRQSYPTLKAGSNFLRPVLSYDKNLHQYSITYTDANRKYYRLTTKDFKSFSAVTEIPAAQYKDERSTISLAGVNVTGQAHFVPWQLVEKLITTYEVKQYRSILFGETTRQDDQRFANLPSPELTITVQPGKAKPISDLLMGIFFEDINYAADGGLYAELIQNRDFEYSIEDKQGRDKTWNSTHSWSLQGTNSRFIIDSTAPVHPNNPHYAVIETAAPGAAIVNTGFDGIVVQKGEQYNFSLFGKKLAGNNISLLVSLVSKNGTVVAKATVKLSAGSWKKYSAVLTANANADEAQLYVQPLSKGKLALDMVSLFPDKTFKGHKNGLRADLAQTIADMQPRFIRFPGGCVAHGDGLNNIYRWKNTIGPLEARIPQRNIWNYHQTAGLGYFEYFRFCEDIGAEPVPVLAAGVPCQNSSTGGAGQQGGIPMDEMDAYVQDILDLIEYANGDVKSKWGKKRAEAGHPEPFNLKYIGIGNEDLITDVFEERFTMIYIAVRAKYPDITVIGTVGPFWEGADYEEGWDIAEKLKVPMVDEHYYQPPGWFIYNQDFYDKYDRSKSKVYLGEYAAHLPGRPNNLETALAEALYLTALERNGDIVHMASYAPLLAKEGHTQWNPDLVYFNNKEVKPTVGYYVQQLYGQHAGDEYLPVISRFSNDRDAVKNRVAYSVVRNTKTNDVLIKLVNLLPVAVNTQLNLEGISLADGKAVKTVLKGDPADKNAKPVTCTVTLTNNFPTTLPAYSFTVLRVKTR